MNIKPTQDPKYGINEQGQLCNIATGVPIPADEPVFMLRAKDMLAEQTLSWYLSTVINGEHKDAVRSRLDDFTRFRLNNPDKMKAPDTVYPFPKPVGEAEFEREYPAHFGNMKIDRKYNIRAGNPCSGSLHNEKDSVLFLAKDKAVPCMLRAYNEECKRLGADENHIKAIELLIERVELFQNEQGSKVPDTNKSCEIERCVEGRDG